MKHNLVNMFVNANVRYPFHGSRLRYLASRGIQRRKSALSAQLRLFHRTCWGDAAPPLFRVMDLLRSFLLFSRSRWRFFLRARRS